MALTENPTLVQVIDEMERLNNLIVDRGGAKTITPSTSNQTLSKGNYKGDITVLGDGDLKPSNIKQGVNIFGVNGNVTVQSLGGKRWASGSLYFENTSSYTELTLKSVTNLGFTPRCVVAYSSPDNSGHGFFIGVPFSSKSQGFYYYGGESAFTYDANIKILSDGFQGGAYLYRWSNITLNWYAFE